MGYGNMAIKQVNGTAPRAVFCTNAMGSYFWRDFNSWKINNKISKKVKIVDTHKPISSADYPALLSIKCSVTASGGQVANIISSRAADAGNNAKDENNKGHMGTSIMIWIGSFICENDGQWKWGGLTNRKTKLFPREIKKKDRRKDKRAGKRKKGRD